AVGMVWFQGGGFCSGSLIAPNVVLTAGHCVQDPIEGFYTGTGKAIAASSMGPTPTTGFTRHAVAGMAAHPTFDPNFSSCPNAGIDIGLVRLAAPLSGVTPVKINSGSAPSANTSCAAAGYGTFTNSRGVDTVEQKRHGTEVVVSAGSTAL